MILVVKNQANSDRLTAVFLVASSKGLSSSIFLLTFWSVSFKFLTSFFISERVSSPCLAVFRSWAKRKTRNVMATTTAIVITKKRNWFRVSDIVPIR